MKIVKIKVKILIIVERQGWSIPEMTNNFNKGRFFNLNNFEKAGWSIPSEGQGWSIPKSDTSNTLLRSRVGKLKLTKFYDLENERAF